ncbi:hypothetical protein B0H17DRAFT_1149408 [Mycena rosella]|uniref:Uncharacterized protein n=1 Tax=Mycena rosella TaxID=1033263 RepID=A0AAD7FU70_MYCRO|nr:hypothetical protein B0H17DRAFT_1149408 [Mycena rosella]
MVGLSNVALQKPFRSSVNESVGKRAVVPFSSKASSSSKIVHAIWRDFPRHNVIQPPPWKITCQQDHTYHASTVPEPQLAFGKQELVTALNRSLERPKSRPAEAPARRGYARGDDLARLVRLEIEHSSRPFNAVSVVLPQKIKDSHAGEDFRRVERLVHNQGLWAWVSQKITLNEQTDIRKFSMQIDF